jgi:hypothetical protein
MKMQTVFGRLPSNQIIRYPSGRYGFVGSVDARLAYETLSGEEPTEAQMDAARRVGPRLAGLRSRSWATEEAALGALAALEVL